MSMMRRWCLALAVLIATIMSTTGVAAASTSATFRYEYYYWSDSSYTTLVGYDIGACPGQWPYRVGETSEYVTIFRDPCD